MIEKYIELVYDDVSHRVGRVEKVSDWKPKKVDRVVYTSIFHYSSSILNYLELSKAKFNQKSPTVKEYDGELFMPYLWIDIDFKDNLVKAVNMTRAIIESINFKYNLPYESMIIYFSGGKGFHIGIHHSVFGGEEFMTPHVKAIARNMVDDIIQGRFVVDYKIYDTTRIFRAPFSRHQSGLYKVDIDYSHILACDIDKIKELAQDCTREISYKYKFERNDLLCKLFKDSVDKAKSGDQDVNIALETSVLEENESIFKVPQDGERNHTLFRQAYRLFGIGLKNNEVADIMKFIYYATNEVAVKHNIDQISHNEFQSLVKSAFLRSRPAMKTGISASNIASMVKHMYNTVKNSKYVDTTIEDFNKDMRGGFVVGNLYSLIGRGGTMKSIVSAEVAMNNAMKGVPSAIFNMEMSNMALFDRIYLRIFMRSFIEEVQKGNITEEALAGIEIKIEDAFKGNLRIVSEVDLEAKDMTQAINRTQDEMKKKINLAVIDSMNSMKMHGESEALTAFQNTKYLKEMSKDAEVATLLINHVTQACPFLLRDCSPYVRGGSKVLDNCDAFFSFSKIADKNLSDFKKKPQDIVFRPGIVYVRFINKRDTGNTIDKIICIEDNLAVTVKDDKPSNYEYYE